MTKWKPKPKYYVNSDGKKKKIGTWTHIKNGAVRAWARNKEQDILAGVEKKIGDAGHVYIISLGFDGLYKIGCTVHIERRLKELKAANPKARCVWSAWIKDMREVERKLHNTFKDQRIDREIFSLSQDDIFRANNFVNNLKESY